MDATDQDIINTLTADLKAEREISREWRERAERLERENDDCLTVKDQFFVTAMSSIIVGLSRNQVNSIPPVDETIAHAMRYANEAMAFRKAEAAK